MKTIDFPQGSPEWLASRAGRVTASRINDVMAKIKTGEAAARRDYKFEIVTEILTDAPTPSIFQNDAMKWGNEQEPFARAAYEVYAGVLVDQVGLVLHPTIERGAASPDGLVNTLSLVEIKCPKTSTHIAYMMDGGVPKQYQNQMLWQMCCCERKSCDFVSFDPRLPEDLQLFVAPFSIDTNRVEEIENEVRQFLMEVDEIVNRLRNRAVAA